MKEIKLGAVTVKVVGDTVKEAYPDNALAAIALVDAARRAEQQASYLRRLARSILSSK